MNKIERLNKRIERLDASTLLRKAVIECLWYDLCMYLEREVR